MLLGYPEEMLLLILEFRIGYSARRDLWFFGMQIVGKVDLVFDFDVLDRVIQELHIRRQITISQMVLCDEFHFFLNLNY